MAEMRILSVPQPYASYAVTGAIDMLVMPMPIYSRSELVIVADDRRTQPMRGLPPGLYKPNIEDRLCKLYRHALGVVDMAGPVEPEETETGIPYMAGKCYLRIANPRIYAAPPPYSPTKWMQQKPVAIYDLWPDTELLTLAEWREQNPKPRERSGPTKPSRDGWTGD